MEDKDIMSAFFSGKIGTEGVIKGESKRVELGDGIGIGAKGSYRQYVQKLAEHSQKGNGIIYLGKDVIKVSGIYSISDPTGIFSPNELPMLLIVYYNVLKDIRIKTVWKDSDKDTILEQFYDIPSAHSNNYDWWSAYSIYFMGPENLDYGDYSVEIVSYQLGYDNKINTYKAEIKFSIEDADEQYENIEENKLDIKNLRQKYLDTNLDIKDLDKDSDAKINQLSNKDDIKTQPETKTKSDVKKADIKKEEVDVLEEFGMR